ncbi:hypothetical protein OIU79_021247 [Salix purpurea]|uniref:Uncharacterized protein n=1 Tax=Salix purpurea TaxID=77065 RepID=A0A9Q0WP02_SALPP|nr:hypothetical protein OIU79_021247 [Salix purpurea]
MKACNGTALAADSSSTKPNIDN